MKNRNKHLAITFTLGVGLTLALLWLPVLSEAKGLDGRAPRVALAQSGTGVIRVATTGNNTSDCGGATNPCRTVQYAVDRAQAGDEIHVATGTYTDVSVRPRNDITTTGLVTQVVYISKTITIQGGYTTTNWDNPDPEANPTTLDAQGQGRVLYITGDINSTIEGLCFTGGNADGLGGNLPWSVGDVGGGVYGITATVTLDHCQISGNTADSGGGVHLYGDNVVLSGNTIFSNTAQGPGGWGLGGGVHIPWSKNVTLSGNIIHSNEATAGGGGIHLWYCNAMVSGNIIHSNEANGGGGIYLWNGHGLDTLLSDNIIFNNTAAQWGGGINMYDSDHVTLSGNSIFSNTAQERGGGIYLNWSAVQLRENTIHNNEATSGGGIYMMAIGSTLVNNVIVDNQASDWGNGLYIAGASPHLLHNTIARNGSAGLTAGGDGSGVYVTSSSTQPVMYSTVVLTNTLLADQAVGINVTGGNTVTVNGILWHDTPITVSQAITAVVTVQNQHTGDPAFALDGYHLTDGSAAIDKGVDAGVADDIDGDPRSIGQPDIGADEWWRTRVHLPIVLRNHAP